MAKDWEMAEPKDLFFGEEILAKVANWDLAHNNEYDLRLDGSRIDGSRFSANLHSLNINKRIRFEPGWHPRYFYFGTFPVIILRLVHESGEMAVWFLSQDFDRLTDDVRQLPVDLFRSLCGALKTLQSNTSGNGFALLDEPLRSSLPWFPHERMRRLRRGAERKIVSLCFSGQPRMILKYRHLWEQFLNEIREVCDVRVFFHAWAQQGLVKHIDGRFVEGTYEQTVYRHLDSLIEFLAPSAFAVDSAAPELDRIADAFPPVALWTLQASKYFILSQLYSVSRADALRRHYEAQHGASHVVLRLRFDEIPISHGFREIEYVVNHPDLPVLFAPSPRAHGHPGGGGGCRLCDQLLVKHGEELEFRSILKVHFANHGYHTNDICDIYSIASPEVMARCASTFWAAADIWGRISRMSALMQKLEVPS